jgi:hypothetical protein
MGNNGPAPGTKGSRWARDGRAVNHEDRRGLPCSFVNVKVAKFCARCGANIVKGWKHGKRTNDEIHMILANGKIVWLPVPPANRQWVR